MIQSPYRVPRCLLKPQLGTVEVDWNNPLTRSLVGVFLFNEGAGFPTELISRIATTFGATPEWTTDLGGRGMLFTYADRDAVFEHTRIPGKLASASGFTLAGLASATATNNNTALLSFDNPGSSGLFILYAFDAVGAGGNGARVYFAGAGMYAADTSPYMDGRPHLFIHTSRSATDHELFIDGVSAGTDATSKSPASDLDKFGIGAWPNDTAQRWGGNITAAFVWARGMSSGEALALTAAPYAFLRPKIVRYYSFPSGAPSFDPATWPAIDGLPKSAIAYDRFLHWTRDR